MKESDLTDREQRIVTLAIWYPDVVDSSAWTNHFSDDAGNGFPSMCRAWNHASYREFERLRCLMRDTEPFTYWHFAEKWIRAPRASRLVCPRCKTQVTPSSRHLDERGNIRAKHKHGHETFWFQLKSVPQVSRAVNESTALEGIRWMGREWSGLEPFIPAELVANAA